jgi:hypothetical protein
VVPTSQSHELLGYATKIKRIYMYRKTDMLRNRPPLQKTRCNVKFREEIAGIRSYTGQIKGQSGIIISEGKQKRQ